MSPQELIRFLETLSENSTIVFGDGRLLIARTPYTGGRPLLSVIEQKDIEKWLWDNPAS